MEGGVPRGAATHCEDEAVTGMCVHTVWTHCAPLVSTTTATTWFGWQQNLHDFALCPAHVVVAWLFVVVAVACLFVVIRKCFMHALSAYSGP